MKRCAACGHAYHNARRGICGQLCDDGKPCDCLGQVVKRERLRSRWTAAQFNAAYPIGTAVVFRPVAPRLGDDVNTRTRSEAWELGNGEPVVMVEGRTGGVALAHITIRSHEHGCRAYQDKAFMPELCNCSLVKP